MRTAGDYIRHPKNPGYRRTSRRGYRGEPSERFARLYKVMPSGCWEWQRSLNPKGYGAFCLSCRTISAHRASWIIHKGNIPTGMHVLHKCDNPRCVNPSHLMLGTNCDNVRDRVQKGRSARPLGLRNSAKLTPDQVLKIRAMRARGDRNTDIAKTFGVADSTISMIVHGHNWDSLK